MTFFRPLRAIFIGMIVIGLSSLAFDAQAKPQRQKYQSDMPEVSGNLKVEILLGEDLAYRAHNHSKRPRDNKRHYPANDNYLRRGQYGDEDLNALRVRLAIKLNNQLLKRGITIDKNAQTVLRLYITDADPSRPTRHQLSESGNMSRNSFGLGGAEFSGTLYKDDDAVGSVSYAWYEVDIDKAATGGTWSDAHKAIDRFAKKLAKTLGK